MMPASPAAAGTGDRPSALSSPTARRPPCSSSTPSSRSPTTRSAPPPTTSSPICAGSAEMCGSHDDCWASRDPGRPGTDTEAVLLTNTTTGADMIDIALPDGPASPVVRGLAACLSSVTEVPLAQLPAPDDASVSHALGAYKSWLAGR